MWADSEEGRGSTFHFSAKFDIGVPRTAHSIERRRELLDGLRVLVVDDNETNRRILEEMLRNWGMAPLAVDGGEASLAAMNRAANAGAPYQLVVSDVNMPDIDGFQLVEVARSKPEHEGIPFIMLTSAARPGDIARCREIGVAAHLTKPIKQSLLMNAIVDAVAGEELTAQADAPTRPTAELLTTDQKLHILLAEDNDVNQKFAVRVIEKAGHSVYVANNGREAVEAWEGDQFDLILMDVHMPEMDGYEATARIRELERERGVAPAIRCVAMTANAMKGDRDRCLGAGMDGYVSKPVKRQTLFAEIDRVLGAS